jgi:N-acetylglucosaminyldiphosphoundecaprenol N-acetyl-beta-D-mannosaminyltransferase
MPLAKSMKILYGVDQDRVAGMDVMPDLMKSSEEKSLSIFLYGATNEVLKAIESKAKRELPNLELHTYSPPFRTLSDKEKEDIVIMINQYNPDFVFVALGCPKQEKWMAEHKNKIHSCMIGLGGAFEVYADIKKRAPQWLQDNSLEWLYRFLQDPKRLWKRYLITNPLFIILLLIQFINIKIFKKK